MTVETAVIGCLGEMEVVVRDVDMSHPVVTVRRPGNWSGTLFDCTPEEAVVIGRLMVQGGEMALQARFDRQRFGSIEGGR
jgi:hypothetical protein